VSKLVGNTFLVHCVHAVHTVCASRWPSGWTSSKPSRRSHTRSVTSGYQVLEALVTIVLACEHRDLENTQFE
jgi:hypothetical protein